MPPLIPNQLLPTEMASLLAQRLKSLRLQVGYKRTSLASRSGISMASLKRFEDSGQISLRGLLALAHALGRLDEFSQLLLPPVATSLAELKENNTEVIAKRGRR